MIEPQLAIDLGGGIYCAECMLQRVCGDKHGPRACQPLFGDPRYGGVNVVHPVRHDFHAYFEEIGGPGFDDITARPTVLPDLPLKMPRIYPRRELEGHLHRSFYAVGADEAIIKRREVLGADDLREMVGLWSNQHLALMLFGKDKHLEQIWPNRHRLAREISNCGYDLVVPPSYSALINHPPSECMRNIKRSLIFFELLQEQDVPTAPRLAWLSDHDVLRAASWCRKNDAVRLVILDLAIKHQAEWRRQLSLLRKFDECTGHRLEYLIHGPHAESRLIDVFGVLGRRLRLSGSRAISQPRESPQDIDRIAAREEAAAYCALLESLEALGPRRDRKKYLVPPSLHPRERQIAQRSLAA